MIRSQIIILTIVAILLTACKKDVDLVIVIPPYDGTLVKFNGIAENEPGSAVQNSVYLDLSVEKITAILRSGWDLGFYCGTDFRVILNNTTSAGAKVLSKNNLASVDATDTIGLTLAPSQVNPLPEYWSFFDDHTGDITKTAILAIAANDTDNPVIILNRGAGGSIPARRWIKLRILHNITGGYTLQYAGITKTTFKTLQIPKDPSYNFKFISFEKGIVEVQPKKDKWDITWSYSLYQTNFGAGSVPYNFSDLIEVNYLAGVMVAEKKYVNAATVSAAYDAFNNDSVAATSILIGRWTIGSTWRSTRLQLAPEQTVFILSKVPIIITTSLNALIWA